MRGKDTIQRLQQEAPCRIGEKEKAQGGRTLLDVRAVCEREHEVLVARAD
jgi:hypothetical protein